MRRTELSEIKSKLIGDESVAGREDNPKEKKLKDGYRCQFCGAVFDSRVDVCNVCGAIGSFEATQYYE